MARTKQTARKNSGGKPLAMARGKDPAPQPKPKPGRSDRKVIIEYSSDEEEPQQGGAPSKKKVKKQIHLTLPTSPTHVTTTESFKTFFINHGLTRALRKAFEKRGWSTNQMQELMTNFRNKYGQTIPLPKIYEDEDTSEDEDLRLGNGTRFGRKTPGGGGCTVLLVYLQVSTDSEFSKASQYSRERVKSKTKKLVDRDGQHLSRLSHDPARTLFR